MRQLIWASLVTANLYAVAVGQAPTPTISVNGVLSVVPAGASPGVAGQTPTAASAQVAATTTADPKQQRLNKIKQLQFDRRPSAILKAWLEFSKPDAAADDAEQSPAETPKAEAPKADIPNDAPAAAEPAQDKEAKAEQEKIKAAKEKSKAEQEKAKAEQLKAEKLFDRELKVFQRDVTLGRWPEVKAFGRVLDKEEGIAMYSRLLESLRIGPPGTQRGTMDPNVLQQLISASADRSTLQAALSAGGHGPGAAYVEGNRFSMIDVAGLVDAAPQALDEEAFTKLGNILRQTLTAGHDLDELLRQFRVTKDSAAPPLVSQRVVARLLSAAGQEARAGDFLPKLDEAERDGDAQGLNLLARYYQAKHAEDTKAAHFENAWLATQAVLTLPPLPMPAADTKGPDAKSDSKLDDVKGADTKPDDAKATTPDAGAKTADERTAEAKRAQTERKSELDAALRRAVELAPRVRKELGQKWLDESFTSHIDRGREILATLGTVISTNLQSRPQDNDFRLKTLQLERTAVEALLRAAPDTASAWQEQLTLLAGDWLKEADVTYRFDRSMQDGMPWRRDRFGNFYYLNEENGVMPMNYRENNSVQAIKTSDLLDARPGEGWLKLVHADLKPKFAMTFSQLHLKTNDDAQAFPFIEQLAATHPDKARELAREFLRVWTRNHNPNESRERQNSFMYYYGYEQRAERIPLTRSKQERNLKELGTWIARLRALPIGDLDEQLLTQAFTTSHSKAEIYRLEAIESVFGPMETLKPRTLAELIQQMRGNLAGVWRLPDVQKQNSTNRKQRDIRAEVLRGYELARSVVKKGLEKHPDHWALVMADAAIAHDENDFNQEIEKSSEFSERRLAALARFQRAAELYNLAVGELTQEEQSPLVYEQWFYASLGSVDLARITAEKVADLRQPPHIRDTIRALPGEAAERHLAQFSNNLFTRLNNAKPELKFRYLQAGFEIVGDHPMAREARKLLDYYGDLVSEIKLEAKIDGADIVGHDQPFGVFVNLLHTKEIERESGGFARYLQNQNNNQAYFYNFGRPTQNYRDKFRETVVQAVGEQFDVVSVTFQDPEVNSKSLPEYGWRVTPYAYLLLKAKGPEVDKIAPMRLDLDFLDTSGYVMLPVETPAVPLDARTEKPPARPVTDITLTQTLDERQAKDGKLVLEIRASGRGLVPRLEELVDLKVPGFQKVAVDGGDVSVSQFDKQATDSAVLSERLWLVTLRANDNEPLSADAAFQFAKAKLPLKEAIYQRYEDADLVSVEPEISLSARYDRPRYAWLWAAALATLAVILGGFAIVRALRSRRPAEVSRYQVPEPATPITVLSLLRAIHHNNGLKETERTELQASIERLERHFFAESDAEQPNLHDIAQSWVARAR